MVSYQIEFKFSIKCVILSCAMFYLIMLGCGVEISMHWGCLYLEEGKVT